MTAVLAALVACGVRRSGPVVRDIDGHAYHAITIGGQVWLAENLRVTRSPDGDALSTFAPNNEPARIERYGRLYNWQSAQRACPRGWHLPTDAEWTSLELFLRGKADFSLRDRTSWSGEAESPAPNRPGFGARPAGYWNDQGFDTFFGTRAVFWTATAQEAQVAWSRVLRASEDSLRRAPQHAHYGFSVRCLRDA